jgi:hypothetical protein
MAAAYDPAAVLTLNDIEVGACLVEALVHSAIKLDAAPIAWPQLLELARFLDPKDAAMARADVLGIATKLRFVAEFCAANGYPNLASLAVHPASTHPKDETKHEAERRAIAACDWSQLPAKLAAYVKAAQAAVPVRLKPRRERPAEVSWYAYYSAHREACKSITSGDKKEIVNLLMAGLDPETALKRFLAAKAAFEAGASG